MPARVRLSWAMKTLKQFLLPVLESFEFAWQVIRYALIFVSAFCRQRASLGCEIVAIRSQLTFYEESIRQKRQPRPRFHPAFRLLPVTRAKTSHTHSGFTNRRPLSPPAAPAAPRFVLSRATESSFQPALCLNNVFPARYGARTFRGEPVDSSPARSTYKWSRTTRPADCSAETTQVPVVW
jgi:hypothetical protein